MWWISKSSCFYGLLKSSSLAGKSAAGSVVAILQNEQLPNELHKLILRKFKKWKVYLSFKDNIWAADLADLQLITKFNKPIKFLLYVINIFSKYAWVVPLKDKKGTTIVNAFQKILDDSMKLHSRRKPKKVWFDQGSEF